MKMGLLRLAYRAGPVGRKIRPPWPFPLQRSKRSRILRVDLMWIVLPSSMRV